MKRLFSLSEDEKKEETLRTFHIENNVETCDKKTAVISLIPTHAYLLYTLKITNSH